MPEEKNIDVNKAREMAEETLGRTLTSQTIMTWAKKYKLGYQFPNMAWGRWIIDKKKWEDFLEQRK